jgi:hypothetical protein
MVVIETKSQITEMSTHEVVMAQLVTGSQLLNGK